MKNIDIIKLSLIVLIIILIAFSIVTNTYARYTSETIITAQIPVAKWDVSAGDIERTFDLFSSSGVYDLSLVENKNDLSKEVGVIDEDVIKTGKTVAPGTWGKIELNILNRSQTKALYEIKIAKINTLLPLEFSIDGKNWIKASTITENYSLKNGTLEIGSSNEQIEKVQIYWKWDFSLSEEQDARELELINAGNTKCEITINAIFKQKT